MQIYTLLDLINDISRLVKLDKPLVIIDYNDLVLKIYYYRDKKISIRTIMNKLRQLERLGLIKMIRRRICEYGVCFSEKTKVYIYRHIVARITSHVEKTKKTAEITRYIGVR